MKSQRRKRDHIINKDSMSFSAALADHTSDSQFDLLTKNDDISFIIGMDVPRGMMTVRTFDLLKID